MTKGLSSGVRVHYGGGIVKNGTKAAKAVKKQANRNAKDIQKEKNKLAYNISGVFQPFTLVGRSLDVSVLSFTQRQQLLFTDYLHPGATDHDGDVVMGVEDDGNDWEDEGLSRLPPGEEAFLQSHAGGEALLQEILEGMTSRSVIFMLFILFYFKNDFCVVSELITAHNEIVFSNAWMPGSSRRHCSQLSTLLPRTKAL